MADARATRVVMVSWKDTAHPRAGGAELYTALALAGLARRGVRATWLVPGVAGLPPREVRRDGVDVIRLGSRATHVPLSLRYLRERGSAVDLVIDQINTYPMFTALALSPAQGAVLVHQLAREVWFSELPAVVGALGWAAEPWLLRTYRRRPTVTVSASTARDLARLGFRDVTIVPNALPSLPRAAERTPPTPPVFVALGRLVRMKRFEHALEALALVRRAEPRARLVVVGRGGTPYAARLAQLVRATPGAELRVDLSEPEKLAVLASATAVVATSVREGFGLGVLEAHAAGTPSVAYDVPGLRDSTRDGVDGLLSAPAPARLAEAMLELRDERLWRRLSAGAVASAREHSVERLEDRFAAFVGAALAGPAPRA